MRAHRRLILRHAAAMLPALPLVLSRRAHAFSTEEVSPGSSLGVAIADRCTSSPEHAALAADLTRELAARGGASGTTLSASETCPVCGCPVNVSYTVP